MINKNTDKLISEAYDTVPREPIQMSKPAYSGPDYTKPLEVDAEECHNEAKASVEINGKSVDLSSIKLDGVDPEDKPDFADASIYSASYEDGTPLTDEELDALNNDQEVQMLINQKANES